MLPQICKTQMAAQTYPKFYTGLRTPMSTQNTHTHLPTITHNMKRGVGGWRSGMRKRPDPPQGLASLCDRLQWEEIQKSQYLFSSLHKVTTDVTFHNLGRTSQPCTAIEGPRVRGRVSDAPGRVSRGQRCGTPRAQPGAREKTSPRG